MTRKTPSQSPGELMKIKFSEKEVKRAIIEYLNAKRYFFVPISNQGTWDGKKGVYRKFTGTKGAPDLMVMDKEGQWICIELKSSTGKQSKCQKEFELIVGTTKHGKYFVVRSIDDLIEAGLS